MAVKPVGMSPVKSGREGEVELPGRAELSVSAGPRNAAGLSDAPAPSGNVDLRNAAGLSDAPAPSGNVDLRNAAGMTVSAGLIDVTEPRSGAQPRNAAGLTVSAESTPPAERPERKRGEAEAAKVRGSGGRSRTARRPGEGREETIANHPATPRAGAYGGTARAKAAGVTDAATAIEEEPTSHYAVKGRVVRDRAVRSELTRRGSGGASPAAERGL